jgi:hypothetical protein
LKKIKVEEYIRTKEGDIFKITNYGLEETAKGDVLLVELNKDFEMEKCNLHIVKHSSNIIDLIEVGDYVNGEPVEQVTEFEITTTTEYLTDPKDIKSICTREQFEKAEYKIDN